ncbi:hypothetical protein BOX15_Mlig003659g3, partial [Macrostomum lignano]
ILVKSLDEYQSNLASLTTDEKVSRIFTLFMAATDPNTGDSWCPDCRAAEPLIEEALGQLENRDDVVFFIVEVGNRQAWSDGDNVFRHLADQCVTGLPTLVEVKTQARLNQTECQVKDKVMQFFAC